MLCPRLRGSPPRRRARVAPSPRRSSAVRAAGRRAARQLTGTAQDRRDSSRCGSLAQPPERTILLIARIPPRASSEVRGPRGELARHGSGRTNRPSSRHLATALAAPRGRRGCRAAGRGVSVVFPERHARRRRCPPWIRVSSRAPMSMRATLGPSWGRRARTGSGWRTHRGRRRSPRGPRPRRPRCTRAP